MKKLIIIPGLYVPLHINSSCICVVCVVYRKKEKKQKTNKSDWRVVQKSLKTTTLVAVANRQRIRVDETSLETRATLSIRLANHVPHLLRECAAQTLLPVSLDALLARDVAVVLHLQVHHAHELGLAGVVALTRCSEFRPNAAEAKRVAAEIFLASVVMSHTDAVEGALTLDQAPQPTPFDTIEAQLKAGETWLETVCRTLPVA